MNCPECGEEMECGILLPLSGMCGYTTSMQWLPREVAMKKTFMPMTKKGVNKCGGEVVRFCSSDIAISECTDAHICKKCRKLMMDY